MGSNLVSLAAGATAATAHSFPPPDWPRAQLCVGLTGGMGGGKSTAARMFAEFGFRVLDSDQVVRDEVLRDPTVLAAIRAQFGAGVFAAAGGLDRRAVAERIFAADVDRRWLEELVHPRVREAWRRALAANPAARWVIEVPLLFESGLENWFDFTVCVATSSALQLSRLRLRGVPADLAEQRIARQLPLPRKIAAADYVLLNDGSLEFLREQVAWLASRGQ